MIQKILILEGILAQLTTGRRKSLGRISVWVQQVMYGVLQPLSMNLLITLDRSLTPKSSRRNGFCRMTKHRTWIPGRIISRRTTGQVKRRGDLYQSISNPVLQSQSWPTKILDTTNKRSHSVNVDQAQSTLMP